MIPPTATQPAMKPSRPGMPRRIAGFLRGMSPVLAVMAAALPTTVRASYYDLTGKNPDSMECITFDVRYPYWTKGIYLATYPGHIRSKEGWISEYYGGIVSNLDRPSHLIQYASWQMKGKGAPATGIDFVHAGRHMSWARSTWEGSSGGIKGMWPDSEFKANQWYRFVHRAWTPAEPVPHTGFAGIWMKDLASGEWHHLATFKFPAELTGFNNMGGFCEYFTDNASEKCALEFRNAYSISNGNWKSNAEFSAFNHREDLITLTQPDDKRSVTLETSRTPRDPQTRKHTQIPVVTQQITLNQPATPDFLDPVELASPTASIAGHRCVVTWQVASGLSPQLGYIVELLHGALAVASLRENNPGRRHCVVELGPQAKPLQARIRISDIFGRDSASLTVPISPAAPLPACAANATLPGLAYRYFESAKPDEWVALPDFAALTPKRQGAVATPDLTPRLSRTGYAFEFTGYLKVPTAGLYSFNLISACGAKLILDDKTVIDADGYNSIYNTPGAVALAPGLHRLSLPYYQGARQYQQADDFLQLTWSGPDFTDQPVPAAAFCRDAVPAEPSIRVKAVRQGSGGINLALTADVSPANLAIERVEYYAVNPHFDYYGAQGSRSADYFLADSKTPANPTPAVIWGGDHTVIRARLIYDGNRTIDSTPIILPKNPSATRKGPFELTQLEHHLYPMAYSADNGSVTLVGESMGLLTQPMTGNGTFIAHLADITSNRPQADGTGLMNESAWYAGIIMRDNLNARPGAPLGGSEIPYATVLGTADGRTRFCDSTMIDGAGNQPRTARNRHRWFKLERQGADFILSSSAEGREWETIKTVNLPKMAPACHVGFVVYAIPSATNRIHWARFDNIRLTKAQGRP